MKRFWNHLRYFCRDAWDEWRHSLAVNLMAMLTLVASLFVVGLVMLVLSNLSQRVQLLGQDVRVDVFLRDGLTEEDRRALEQELTAMDGVQRLDFIDKDQALQRYRAWAGELAELANELETNPLPASLEVYLDTGQGAVATAGQIAQRLHGVAAVEEVRFNRDLLEKLESMLDLARIGGIGLALVVFVAIVFVMAGVLRLAVLARRDEIEIMHLVGATPAFIRGPFLVAGFMQGLMASGVALLILEGVRRVVMASASSGSLVLMEIIAARQLPFKLALALLVAGLAISLTGSFFAVRQTE